MTAKKTQMGWYRAHFDTGVLEFQARHIGHARELIRELAPVHYPGEKLYSIGTLAVRTRGGVTKRVAPETMLGAKRKKVSK